jgi:cold shock protein
LTRGRVHWYSKGLGHGFIEPEDGDPMAFVRRDDIGTREEQILENNDEVSFEVVQGTEGPEARNVSRVRSSKRDGFALFTS